IAAVEVLLAWRVSRAMSRSLEVLEGGAERIARQQFDRPIPPPPEPELASLALTLNDDMRTLAAHNREAARMDEERIKAARERLNQVVRAQERERARVSRELHDQASQALTALNYGLTRVRKLLRDDSAAAEIDRLLSLSADTGRQIGALARDLRPGALDDLGLVPALRSYARDFSDRIGVPVAVSVRGPIPRLSGEAETVVFRVIQEALTNVAKHAQAQHVTVDVRLQDSCLKVDVADDGQGFDAEAVLSESTGSVQALGLTGIRERVQLVEGDFRISSRPGQGTRLSVRVPAPRAGSRSRPCEGWVTAQPGAQAPA
ncbi:MAG: sensor histidine kinase, partial [Chloroflexota bacterium]|nr:sensor histidine kinase [Chloroflexota bacterium]